MFQLANILWLCICSYIDSLKLCVEKKAKYSISDGVLCYIIALGRGVVDLNLKDSKHF